MKPAGVALAALACALAGTAIQAPPPGRAPGFTSESFARERAQESRFAAGISRDNIRDYHRLVTDRPHLAGTPGGRHIALAIRDRLRANGLETEIVEYRAYLSTPQEVGLRLTAPEPAALRVDEPASAGDPDSRHADLTPGFVAYSASGTVEAPVVYVNYGLPADYERLRAAGISVRGRIVLARYGRSHRAVKVYTAEVEDASGIIIYSDPADDGATRGSVWPDGRWRAPFQLQRGNAKYSWLWHGDPLTPGVPARADTATMDPGKAPTLPRIPALAISADEARRILARIEGADAPAEFTGGLSIRYRLGPGPAAVRMHVKMLGERRPIFNVIGSIPGSGTPDRWVMLGTHHDAWTFGGTDPGSAVAVLMEVARGLSALRNEGWRPTRSIKFCFWDAEEFGLVGSTEFAEDRAREIREKAVAYINTDMYMAGSLVAGGLPSLREFVAGIARDVPGENGSLFSNWVEAERQRGPAERAGDGIPELRPLGSGADFVAFQDHLGVPALSLELLTPSGWVFGTYHSAYDTRRTFERHGDPEYRQGPRLAHVLGLAAMRLAGADALPFRYRHYATTISSFVGDVERWVADAGLPARDRAVGSLRRAAAEVDERAGALDGTVDRLLGASVIANRACLGELNDALARIEQTLLSPDESPGASWYKHVLYGWNIYSLYDGQPLPRVAEAIRVRDVPAVDREIDRVRAAVTRMRDALAAAAIICR